MSGGGKTEGNPVGSAMPSGGLGSGFLGAQMPRVNSQQAMAQQPSEMMGSAKRKRFNPKWMDQTNEFGDPRWMTEMPKRGMLDEAWQLKSQMPMSTNTQQAMAQQPSEVPGAAPLDRGGWSMGRGRNSMYATAAERAYGPGGGIYGMTGQIPAAAVPSKSGAGPYGGGPGAGGGPMQGGPYQQPVAPGWRGGTQIGQPDRGGGIVGGPWPAVSLIGRRP